MNVPVVEGRVKHVSHKRSRPPLDSGSGSGPGSGSGSGSGLGCVFLGSLLGGIIYIIY